MAESGHILAAQIAGSPLCKDKVTTDHDVVGSIDDVFNNRTKTTDRNGR
jgi:hypothetical protein